MDMIKEICKEYENKENNLQDLEAKKKRWIFRVQKKN